MGTTETSQSRSRNLLGFDIPLNDIASYSHDDRKPRFPNALQDWFVTPRTLRERAMIAFMSQITDKPEWTRKINDTGIIQNWKAEAANQNEGVAREKWMTEQMVDFCLQELHDYAKCHVKHGFVPAVRASATVFKSDTIVGDELKYALREAVAPLENIPDKLKDWHPNSKEQVLDLVHPSLFPLVYGRSRILSDDIVGLDDCEEFIGKGEAIPKPDESQLATDSDNGYMGHRFKDTQYYSNKFQWLPCEVKFDGEQDIKITSYINNLHPRRHGDLYNVLEKIIARTIPMWDATLGAVQDHRRYAKTRIDVKDPYYIDPKGERPKADNEDELDDHERFRLDEDWIRAYRTLIWPEPPKYNSKDFPAYEVPILTPRKAPSSEPPKAKSGRIQHDSDESNDVHNDSDNPPKNGLRQLFTSQGLQLIIKLANIHLTPSNPSYDGGSWHIEGQLNERICASALYYYDSHNITPSHLSFREMVDCLDFPSMQGDNAHVQLFYDVEDNGSMIQEFGSVLTKENRLLTFPNVCQHRVSPFSLSDTTQPGHRKILALFLVDPYLRIPSTANVPPQQRDWWRDSLQTMEGVGDTLPVEMVDRIVENVEDWPIGLDEAKMLRLELMKERRAFVSKVDERYEGEEFTFCEH